MSQPDFETRLQEMETRYMLLERFIEELSDVVAAQQLVIDNLQATLARLRPQLMNLGEERDSTPDPPPPHY